MTIFFIADMGVNHNGDVDIAKQLIDVAVESGADAVKFQKRTVDQVYTREQLDVPRKSPWGRTHRNEKRGLEFGLEEYRAIDAYCREKGVIWFASAWDLESQHFLRPFACPYNKIASEMIFNEELLREVASEGKPTFISTGMATVDAIDRAVEIFKEKGCPFEVMHCVSAYPMDDEDANLHCIKSLRDRYQCKVGYSGHEVGLAVSYAAAALGITSLKRFVTLSRAMYGAEQTVSVEPPGLRQLVGAVRKIECAMGDGVLGVQKRETSKADQFNAYLK